MRKGASPPRRHASSASRLASDWASSPFEVEQSEAAWTSSLTTARRTSPVMTGFHPVGCINSARPRLNPQLAGRIEFSHRTPPRPSHTRSCSACPHRSPLSTQVRKRVRLGQK